jgi:hypothetical protein
MFYSSRQQPWNLFTLLIIGFISFSSSLTEEGRKNAFLTYSEGRNPGKIRYHISYIISLIIMSSLPLDSSKRMQGHGGILQ